MSIRYIIFENFFRIIGFKRLFRLPTRVLVEKTELINKRRHFYIPKDKKYFYGAVSVMNGKYNCLTIQKHRQPAKQAILVLYGGGMITAPDSGDINTAAILGNECSMDVWFPYYPLCIENSISEAYDMVLDTYRKMLEVYEADNITISGFSSGASLAIGLCLHINALGKPLPMPHRIAVSSPGSCPRDNAEYQKMRQLNKKDIIVDSVYMKKALKIMRHGENVPRYMLSNSFGDFRGLPEIDFWYGSNEVLYACVDNMVKACIVAGVKYRLTVGEGLCHCYPAFIHMPEGRRGLQDMADVIAERK